MVVVAGRQPGRQGGLTSLVVDVDTDSGWRLCVTERPTGHADATVSGPDGDIRYQNVLWPTVHRAIEDATDYVRQSLELPAVATALKQAAFAELAA